MNDLIITIYRGTRKVKLNRGFIGLNGENLQGNIVVDFSDKADFIDGTAYFEIKQHGEKYFIEMAQDKENKLYTLPIKSSLLKYAESMPCQIRIEQTATADGVPVFKSDVFQVLCREAVNATETIPEQYPSWRDEMDEAIARANAVSADLEKKVANDYYRGEQGIQGEKGEGVNSLFETVYSTNLLDLSKVEEGKYVYNGKLSDNSVYFTTAYIPCKAGETLRLQYDMGGIRYDGADKPNYGGMRFISAYDINKVYIEGSNASECYTYTCPDNTAYVRISASIDKLTGTNGHSNLAIVKGETAEVLPYEEYSEKLVLKAEHNNDGHIKELIEAISDDADSANPFFETVYSTNLLDLSKVEEGTIIVEGVPKSGYAQYTTSGYIPCKAGDTIRYQFDYNNTRYDSELKPAYGNIAYINAFNSNKGYIANSYKSGVAKYICPEGTAYVRVSIGTSAIQSKNNYSNPAIVKSETAVVLPYEEYSEQIILKAEHHNGEHIKALIDGKVGNIVDAYLPTDIYCAVGRTVEIYNNQVCLQASKYHLKWTCAIGKALSRKFSVTGLENQIGNYPVTLAIYNDNLEIVWAGSTTLHIVANTINTAKSVCPIGDSLTNIKPWEAEVINLSQEKISFVGTYTATSKDANGANRTYGHEGRSGFSAKGYNTATIYTFGKETEPHAFWDGTRFNWNYYKTNSGLNPDCVQIYLGTNGIANDNTENAGYIKQIVDYIRQDDAAIPIFVVNTIYRGTQNGIGVQQSNDGYASMSGVFKYNEDKKVMDLMKRLDALLADYDGVYMINLALTHDSEYNFGAIETAVNPRASQTELMPTESVHPQAQGYYQMADVIYSVYCAVFG